MRASHEVATGCSCGRESTEPVCVENQSHEVATGKIAVATSWLSKFERSFSVDLRPQLNAVATIVAGMQNTRLPESSAKARNLVVAACL